MKQLLRIFSATALAIFTDDLADHARDRFNPAAGACARARVARATEWRAGSGLGDGGLSFPCWERVSITASKCLYSIKYQLGICIRHMMLMQRLHHERP